MPSTHPLALHDTASSRLVQALRGHRPEVTPVWFMRQAGRSLPEYRALRATGGSMLDACLDPAMASEITLQPVRRHRVDAAVFFSDIVVPLKLVGLEVEIVAGRGPVFTEPVRTAAQIAELVRIDPALVTERGEEVAAAVARTTELLADESALRGEPIPLIGFAGAPFTLAAYLVEGGPSKDHLGARSLIHSDPAAWHDLTAWLAEVTGRFLALQVQAGASAVQLFDSWAGSLTRADYTGFVADHSATALSAVAGRVPRIHFGTGTGHLLEELAVGADGVGIDYRTPLDEAAARLPGVALQGNIDPALLAAGWAPLEAHTLDVLARGEAAPGHVVNLGHGVPPDTDPGVLTALVERIHAA